MYCKRCNSPIPQNASKCGNCGYKSGYYLSNKPFPDYDMYENQVIEFIADENKKNARQSYIETLPDYKRMKELQDKGLGTFGKVFALIICTMPIATIIAIVGIFLAIYNNIVLGALLLIFGIGTSITVCAIIMKKIISKDKPRTVEIQQIKMHNDKLRYYFNGLIIGYSVLDHTTRSKNGATHYYYAFYEVDKRNIKSIGYDSYFAEYVLYLDKAVFVHYDFAPVTEFRIADIFSDSVLNQVLGCDLPPKYMLY